MEPAAETSLPVRKGERIEKMCLFPFLTGGTKPTVNMEAGPLLAQHGQ